MPRYNIFAEMANRIQINKELYLAQYPELASNINNTRDDAAAVEDYSANTEENIPNLSAI